MSFSKYKTERLSGNIIVNFLKGLIVSMLITFALIIVLAFSLKWLSIDEKYISPINLAIKVLSVLIGSSIAVKGEDKGLLKGVLFGFLYITIAFLSFSLLANTFMIDLSLLLDLICTCIAGGIVGIFKVNAR